jgi:hypothetical protein
MKFQRWTNSVNCFWNIPMHLIIVLSLLTADGVRKCSPLSGIYPILLHLISFVDDSRDRLRVLPGTSVGDVAGEGVEAQASIVEVNALKTNEDLVGAVVGRAGDERTVGVGEDAEAVARADGPASLDSTLSCDDRVGLGVLEGTGVGLNVDLLASRYDHTHREGVLAASESGEVAGRACADILDALGAEGGGLLVEPDGLTGSGDSLVVDGRGRSGGGEAEVLSGSSREEAGEGSDGEGGLHFELCFGVWSGLEWLCWLELKLKLLECVDVCWIE